MPSDQAEAIQRRTMVSQVRKVENKGKGDLLLTPTGFVSALAACAQPDGEHCTHTGG